MSLSLRFILLSIILVVISSFAAWSSVSSLAEEVIEEWAVRYAEKQVLYDRQRTLQPLIRELALSRQFSQSQDLIDFARNPEDPELRRRAIKEMESFRFNFLEMNYFVALAKSGEYFHNDANNTYQGNQLRYVLNPENPDDAWFYKLMEQRRDLHVNVNYDASLDVTKIWMDILLTDGDEVLGVVGTGLNLSVILNEVAQQAEKGVNNIFVDYNGTIQLHHNSDLVNLSSFTRPADQLHNVEDMVDSEKDKRLLRQAMAESFRQKDKVVSHYVNVEGHRSLMAVAYLPEIDWYEVTLIDIDTLLPISRFSSMFIVYGITLIVLILALNLAIRFMVLRPLSRLNHGMNNIRQGRQARMALKGPGEIGRLMQHFNQMADEIAQTRDEMDARLEQQNRALDRAKRIDPVTNLLNRNTLLNLLKTRFREANDNSGQDGFSLIWLDIDFLKEINDRYGHEQGDEALQIVAEIVRKHIDDDIIGTSGRWGDDEILASVSFTQPHQVLAIAETIRLEIERSRPAYAEQAPHHIPLTVSIGACISADQLGLRDALNKADAALYRAKSEGRNLVRLNNTTDFGISSRQKPVRS